MKDTLIVYYSLDGNSELVATALARLLDADLLRVRPVKELRGKGFGKYIWGGRQVVMKSAPKLQPMDKDIDDYANVVVGTPVWAFSYSPPIQTLFKNGLIRGKRAAVYCCHEGGPGSTIRKMTKRLSGAGNIVLGGCEFREPKRDPKAANKEIEAWAGTLLEALGKDET